MFLTNSWTGQSAHPCSRPRLRTSISRNLDKNTSIHTAPYDRKGVHRKLCSQIRRKFELQIARWQVKHGVLTVRFGRQGPLYQSLIFVQPRVEEELATDPKVAPVYAEASCLTMLTPHWSTQVGLKTLTGAPPDSGGGFQPARLTETSFQSRGLTLELQNRHECDGRWIHEISS